MTKSHRVPVWIDCDPGNDDVFAILLAMHNPYLQLIGISTSYGNVGLELTTHNTIAFLEYLGSPDIPVYQGSSKPLEGDAPEASYIHGTTGIGGAQGYLSENPHVKCKTDINYIEAINNAAKDAHGELCVIVTGPLTNLSKVLDKYPNFGDQVQYISIMGGAFGLGNITPYAEFNLYSDPLAAEKVFTNEFLQDNKLILSPLNITHKCIATKAIRNTFKGKKGSLFRSITNFYAERYAKVSPTGPPVHDPVAVFSLIAVLERKQKEYGYQCWHETVQVALEGEKRGETTMFENGSSNGVYIGYDINPQAFWDAVSDAIVSLEHNN